MIPIRPPLAMVLALFLPGAGHLYAGWPRRAVLFAALLPATLVLLCVATATRALSVSAFVPLVFVVPIVLQVIAAVDAGRRASTPILAPNRVSNRGVVVGFALGSLAVTLFTAMVLEGTTLSARRMSSATMTPSLLVGDYVVVRRPAFITAIAQGDILEFRFPRDPRFTYLQRVMGTGNQLVSFEAPDPKTPPSVDGLDRLWSRAQAESWQSADCTVRAGEVVDETIPAPARTYRVLLSPTAEPSEGVLVPEDSLFVVNDNRKYRSDSRTFGAIAEREVSGQVLGIGFSWDPCAGSVRGERVGDLD